MRVSSALLAALLAAPSWASTIHVAPSDGDGAFALIEAAMAGDEVVIAPGTYRFLVYLQNSGTAQKPIVIHAADPANRPVWDLGATKSDDAPGSYTGSDRGRGCWQVAGNYYQISGIEFTNCRGADPGSSSGLRYYNDAIGLLISDCIFRLNDNGLTGGSQNSEATAQFCEFDRNGEPATGGLTHNVYIYAGDFALRYSLIHDSTDGLNLHCRALDCTVEYNWFARANGPEMQFDSDDHPPDGPFTQTILVRGNVIVQNQHPTNDSKVITLYNDEMATVSFAFRALSNTFIGNGGKAAFVELANDDGTTMSAELSNNILFGTTVAATIDDDGDGTLTGAGNWLATGTDGSGLTGSIVGGAPGFTSASDFTLAPGSACIGKAAASVADSPDREYFQNETNARMYRLRSSVSDIGAFEHDTAGPGIGPYNTPGTPDGGTNSDGGPTKPGASIGGGGAITYTNGFGCGCAIGAADHGSRRHLGLLLAALLLLVRRRRR